MMLRSLLSVSGDSERRLARGLAGADALILDLGDCAGEGAAAPPRPPSRWRARAPAGPLQAAPGQPTQVFTTDGFACTQAVAVFAGSVPAAWFCIIKACSSSSDSLKRLSTA
jgi:hypothetical protein